MTKNLLEEAAGVSSESEESPRARQERIILKWLFSGDSGVSSEALAAEFLGVGKEGIEVPYPPSDPSDLGRCLRLIDKVPAVRACVDSLATKNHAWARIAPIWDALAASMVQEVGLDWKKGRIAPKTYKMMQEVKP